MGYKTAAVKGVSWNGLLKLVSMGIAAARIFVLARLLSPNDFGIASITLIILGITDAFTETGINTIIIQSKKELEYFVDTAWVISILRGLIISIIMLIASIPIAHFFQSDQLVPMIGLAALVPLIKGFINPAVVKYLKDLRFLEDTVYRFSLVVVEAAVAILLACIFHSVFIFVWALIVVGVFEVIISFSFFSLKPKFAYLPSRAREIFSQIQGLNLNTVLGYLIQNADNFTIGKILGTTELGFYANGYSLSHKMNVELAKSVMHGTFPILAKISGDTERLRKAFWKTLITSMGLFTLIGIPFILFPQFLIPLLLGDKWVPIIPIFPLLVVAGIVQSLPLVITPLLLAKKVYFWLNANLAVNFVALVALVIWLTPQRGLMGAVVAVLIARVIALPFSFMGVKKALYD
jgi:O-antigen/teichoic acid export membrane protein